MAQIRTMKDLINFETEEENQKSLHSFLIRKFGTLTRAWRCLATSNKQFIGREGVKCTMELNFGAWCESLRVVGYRGDLRQTCKKPMMTYKMLDKSTWKKIIKFVKVAQWIPIITTDQFKNTRRIHKDAFILEVSRWTWSNNMAIGFDFAEKIFRILSTTSAGDYLTIEDIQFARQFEDKKEDASINPPDSPSNMKVTKSFLNLKNACDVQRKEIKKAKLKIPIPLDEQYRITKKTFREWIIKSHKSLELFWKKVLELECDKPKKLSKKDKRAGKEEDKGPKKATPIDREHFCNQMDTVEFEPLHCTPEMLWAAITKTTGDNFMLSKEFFLMEDPDPLIQNFRECILKAHGVMWKWFKTVDPGRHLKLTRKNLEKACNLLSWDHNPLTLFKLLDPHNTGFILLEDIDKLALIEFYGEDRVERARCKRLDQIPERKKAAWDTKRALKEFVTFLEKMFNSCVVAWRFMDKDGLGKLGWVQFKEAVWSLGYAGNITRLWNSFPEGSITVDKLCPRNWQECKQVKEACEKVFTTLKHAFDEMLRQQGNIKYFTDRLVSIGSFCETLLSRCGIPAKISARLFASLAFDNTNYLSWEEFKNMEMVANKKGFGSLLSLRFASKTKKETHESLLEERTRHVRKIESQFYDVKTAPDYRGKLFKFLINKYGSLVRAFRLGFDRYGKEKVSYEEFASQFRFLKLKKPMLYFTLLDENNEGYLTLKDFDPEPFEQQEIFNQKVIERFGDLPRFFTFLENTQLLSMDENDFKWLCGEVGYMGNPKKLFSFYDIRSAGFVRIDEIHREASYAIHPPGKLKKLVAKANKLEDLKDPRESSKDKSTIASESMVEEKVPNFDLEEVREFIVLLEHKYGNFINAWRLLLDKEGKDSVGPKMLLFACIQLRWKKSRSRDLWNKICHVCQRPGVSELTFKEIDPRRWWPSNYSSLDEDFKYLKDCMTERYGSVAKVFIEADNFFDRSYTEKEWIRLLKEINFVDRNPRRLTNFLGEIKNGEKRFFFAAIDFKAEKEAQARLKKEKVFASTMPNFKTTSLTEDFPPPLPPTNLENLVNYLVRKFNSTSAAWFRVMDRDGHWSMREKEFIAACRATGWPGPIQFVWREMMPYASYAKLDPGSWHSISTFYESCKTKYGNLKNAWALQEYLPKSDFEILCDMVEWKGEKSQLLNLLNVHGEDINVLGIRQPEWLKKWVSKSKKRPKPEAYTEFRKYPPRPKVENGIPAIKSNWNTQHYLTKSCSLLTQLHELNHVQTQDKMKFMKKIDYKIATQTLDEWYSRHLKNLEKRRRMQEELEKQRKEEAEWARKEAEKKSKQDAMRVKLDDNDF